MGPTWECFLGVVVVVVVVQYPGVQVYNNYPFKSSEQPVSFALTATNTHPSTLPVITGPYTGGEVGVVSHPPTEKQPRLVPPSLK